MSADLWWQLHTCSGYRLSRRGAGARGGACGGRGKGGGGVEKVRGVKDMFFYNKKNYNSVFQGYMNNWHPKNTIEDFLECGGEGGGCGCGGG